MSRFDGKVADFPIVFFFYYYFIQWKPTDTWPRDRCGRAQLSLLPSLADFLHLGADLCDRFLIFLILIDELGIIEDLHFFLL